MEITAVLWQLPDITERAGAGALRRMVSRPLLPGLHSETVRKEGRRRKGGMKGERKKGRKEEGSGEGKRNNTELTHAYTLPLVSPVITSSRLQHRTQPEI